MPKSRKQTFHVSEEGRKLVAIDRDGNPLPGEAAREFFHYLDLWQGRNVVVEIRSPPASKKQRGYLFGVVIPYIQDAFKEAGHAKRGDDIYEHFKWKYLPCRVYDVFGVEHIEPPSTSHLDTWEMTYFIEEIRNDEDVLALLAALEWPPIPDPDPNWKHAA